MAEYEQSVFISYAWGGEREEVANQIDQALQKRGIKIIRDKRDLGYKGSIKEFMERIGQGDCVIVVISDKYLRSPNCMFELVEFADGQQFRDRIFPVILNDANIYDPLKRIDYVKFWEMKHKELAKAMKKVDPANLQGIREEIDLYVRIRGKISSLTSILKDMNVLTPDRHQESDFSDLYSAIEKRIKESKGVAKAGLAQEIFKRQLFEPETILIPNGSFWMGSPPGDGIPDYETPPHEVHLEAFRIGKYPVTIAQYEEFIMQNKQKLVTPSMGWDGQRAPKGKENYPVTGVTWFDALEYCKWLKEKTGWDYMLPNEAQWEKACRGGSKTLYPWGDEFDMQRCNSGRTDIAPVDAYPPQSEYGYDFVGNIRQWTCTLWGEDRFTPDSRFPYNKWRADDRNNLEASPQIRRVVRGSTFKNDIRLSRCSARIGWLPKDYNLSDLQFGFRVGMNISLAQENSLDGEIIK